MRAISFFFLLSCITGALSVIWAVISAVRMTWQFKSSSDRFSKKTIWNPMNALLFPNLLTEKGLGLRRQVGYALALFAGCLVVAGGIALLAKSIS